MAIATAIHGGYIPFKFRSLPPVIKITGEIKQLGPPPLFISTNPAHVNIHHLKDLYAWCNHSSHRFPDVESTGRVEAVDFGKLRTAVLHSSVVVSVFTKPEFVKPHSSTAEVSNLMGISGEWIKRVMPVTPDNGQLIGFGRAVSDSGLTATIYDVMVLPALQGRGIGRMIVKRIIRMLTNRDIYDIAALCSVKERLFFRACGFGDDILGSTTMMYTRNSSNSIDGNTVSVGRKQLTFMGRILLPVLVHYTAEGLPEMGKLWVEICLISGRGLRRTSTIWKLQWFAVGWIDPNNQYCTSIDASGNNNPVWKTKFSVSVDTSEPNFKDLALHVEVYSREPIFLRQSLLGTATIVLKEFMDKYISNSEVSKPVEEVGSFQLRKKNSNKPQGFVDISIRISEERKDEGSSSLGAPGEVNLIDQSAGIKLVSRYGPQQAYQPQLPQQPLPQIPAQQTGSYPMASGQYAHPTPFPTNYSQPPNYTLAGGPSNQPPRTPTPLPPPPPSNVGYIPSFLPQTNNLTPRYVNMPSSAGPPGRAGPGFATGVGAGALAAGAMIFGDDFMSGFDLPGSLRDASLTISADPPF